VAELHAGVFGGELPVDLTLVGVGGGLPGGEFAVEDFEVAVHAALRVALWSIMRVRSLPGCGTRIRRA